MGSNEIEAYYNQGREHDRLTRANGQFERARTQELILRYVTEPKQMIVDVGGGAGIYALWLAQLGHAVNLVDLMEIHVQQASEASAQADKPLASIRQGDARRLDFPDGSADVVLMLGPLYHLTERGDRLQALHEAYRILKPGGVLLAATISQFASMMDGMMRGHLKDDYFAELVQGALTDSRHRNTRIGGHYFTTAYFHHPDEIQAEVKMAGFALEAALAIEGPAGFIPNFDEYWDHEVLRERLMTLARTVEREPSMLGATGHLMTVGRKG